MDWSVVDRDPLALLVEPQGSQEFLREVWEQRPFVFKSTPKRKQLLNALFNFKQLQRLANQQEEAGDPLLFGQDLNAARYVDGVRETPNGDVADSDTLKDLFVREGCTLQVHQPQRFVDPLWRLMAALERQLGCLVGCNAYLTPKHTQGLAPHHDDVEIFVVQTEGCKQWSLYRPQEGPYRHRALANHCSGDLVEAHLGPPFMQFVLEVGDVLYMPRGTIHQARALSTHSAHLTLSTHQRWSVGDLMQYTVSVALANPQLQPHLPAPLLAGLPPGWVFTAAAFSHSDAPLAAAADPPADPPHPAMGTAPSPHRQQLLCQLAAAFRSVADWLEGRGEGEGGQGAPPSGHKALLAAGDAMAEDFMRSRLPPHPEQLPDPGPEPQVHDRVASRGTGLFRLVPLTEDDGPDEEEDEDDQGLEGEERRGRRVKAGPAWIRLVSCLGNDREMHMMSGGRGTEEGEGDGAGQGEVGCCSPQKCNLGCCEVGAVGGGEGGSESGSEGMPGEEARGKVKEGGACNRKRKLQKGSAGDSTDEERGESDGDSEEEEEQQEDIVFPMAFSDALLVMLGAAVEEGGVCVGDLPLPAWQIKQDVARVLWQAGALVTLPQPSKSEKGVQRGGGGSKKSKKPRS